MAGGPASVAPLAGSRAVGGEAERAHRLEIHAKPRAKKSAVRSVGEGAIDVALAAPPVDGAANEELVRFLADVLDLPKKSVRLLRGESSRTKLVEIIGLERHELDERLRAAVRA